MNKTYLYVSISVSGASVLAVEILGTRIIGPFYGVDLFLWSALISVTLAALAAGYWLGGRWADRGPAMGRFSSLFVAAGLWLVLLPALRGTAMEIARPLPHRAELLSAAAMLFFPPLAVLGMVSPYALKLRVRSVGEVGRSAGNLYAVSTLASVGAALLVGFVLVPNFGVKSLASAIGIILAATGAAGFFIGRVFSAGRRPRAAGEPQSQ
ncbi:MAG: fused MFS/spermidine synthase [Candidatus Krumholzibacteria bacterium]|jgi:predicted membrane-bound spermidine synthase|nr:fused MFS/spermidine synthase [Candidatus Krumholzibacteria bacterium]